MLSSIVNRACLVLFSCTLLFAIHSFVHNPDPYHCDGLVNGGQWINLPKQWQPPGCMMRSYQKTDTAECRLRNMTFIGHSTMRQLLHAALRKVVPISEAQHFIETSVGPAKHQNITFPRPEGDIHFNWDPYLNGTSLRNHLDTRRSGKPEGSSIVVIGGGLWHARQLGDRSVPVRVSASQINAYPPLEILIALE